MTGTTSWQENNARYLSAALTWLRERLEHRTRQEPRPVMAAPEPPPPVAEESRRFWRRFRPGDPGSPARRPQTLLPAAPPTPAEEHLERAQAEMAAAAQSDPPPALLLLSRLLGLSRFEQEVLLLCAAMELDTRIAGLCGRASGDTHQDYPTFALALGLFDEPAWDALSPEHPLRYWRLLEISQGEGHPLTASRLRADERIVDYIKGLNYLDDRLGPLLSLVEVPGQDAALPASQNAAAETIVRHLRQAPTGSNLPVVQLLGSDSPSKQLVAAQAARALGLRLYRMPAALLPSQALEVETLSRLWQRECLLLPMAMYVDTIGADADAAQSGPASALSRVIGRMGGAIFLDTRDVWPGIAQGSVQVDVAKPTPEEQEAEWAAALADAAGDNPAKLAGQFNMGQASILQIAREELAVPATDARPLNERLWDACLETNRPRLDMLAQRLQPKATWKDLVLPAAESSLLQQIAAQVDQRSRVYQTWEFGKTMSRGLGISALFAGDSGTGKTMAAEVIANQLRLEPVPHRSVGGGEQVYRRDGKESASHVRRGGGWRRDPVFR